MTAELKFEEVTGVQDGDGIQFIRPKDLTELEGIFIGIQEGKYGTNYEFELEDGGRAVVNGCGSLHKKLPNVAPGSLVKLINDGKKEITTGANKGKSFHNIRVLVAEA